MGRESSRASVVSGARERERVWARKWGKRVE